MPRVSKATKTTRGRSQSITTTANTPTRRSRSPSGVSAPLAASPRSNSKVSLSSSKDDSESDSLPLAERSIDYWLLVWYGVFWFTVVWTDLHNFSASLRTAVQWEGKSWSVQDLERHVMDEGKSLYIPPHFLSYLYFRWARTADPLLYQNPIWWQCIEWVNLLCLMPFSLVALRAFYVGNNNIRLPAIIVSSFTFYSLILCIGSSLFGDEPSKVSANPEIFFFIYVPYMLFPMIVVARLWGEKPFSQKLNATLDFTLKAMCALIFSSFGAAGLAWYLKCEAGTKEQNLKACPLCSAK